jgi:hypothetical protein
MTQLSLPGLSVPFSVSSQCRESGPGKPSKLSEFRIEELGKQSGEIEKPEATPLSKAQSVLSGRKKEGRQMSWREM